MKVKILKTGETKHVNESYGLRLITQGQAVLCKAGSAAKRTDRKQAAAETAGDR